MGQVLSQPISSQLLSRDGNNAVRVGVSEMQGFRINMEDAYTVKLSLSEKHPDKAFFGVYDGHAGERASAFLESELHKFVGELDDPTDAEQLKGAVLAADAKFCEDEAARQDGSTAVFAVVSPIEGEVKDGKKQWNITVSNVGDSRAILIRANGEFVALTEDHKPELEAESARIVRAGGMVQANRVDGQLAMSRAMGDWGYKDDSTRAPADQKVIATPDITSVVAYENDVLLVCCDGIVEQLSNEQVATFLHRHLTGQADEEAKDDEEVKSIQLTADVDPAQLMEKLLHYSLEAGSKDNHSAMLIGFGLEGNSYKRDPEFIAGPFRPFQNDKQFVKAYNEDAAKHGYEGEELLALAAKAEENMPEIKPDESGPPGMMLQQLLVNALGAGAGGPGGEGDPASMQEQLLALLQGMGGGVDIGDEDDDGAAVVEEEE